jgi:DNA-binding MarR family transcriptional regulator
MDMISHKPSAFIGALLTTALLAFSFLAPTALGAGIGPVGPISYDVPYLELCTFMEEGSSSSIDGTHNEVSFALCIHNPTNDSVSYHFSNGHLYNLTIMKGEKVFWQAFPAEAVFDPSPVDITVPKNSSVNLGNYTVKDIGNGHYTFDAQLVGYDLPFVGAYFYEDSGCNLFECWASGGAGTYDIGQHPEETAAVGIGGGGLIAGLGVLTLTEPGKYAGMAMVAPLFTRLKKRQVLDNFTRGRIEGYIMANPGAHMNAIRDAFELSNGVVAYHLKVLEREGFVNSMNDGLKRRFYPGDKLEPKDHKQELSVTQNLLVSIMEKNPGVTQTELAKMAGTSPQVVNYHIRKLWRMDLITMDKDGRVVKCWVKKEKLALFKRGQPNSATPTITGAVSSE